MASTAASSSDARVQKRGRRRGDAVGSAPAPAVEEGDAAAVAAVPLPSLPAFWAAAPRLLVAGGAQVDGQVLLVFMTKGILVQSGSELNRLNGQRDWRDKAQEVFGAGPIEPAKITELALALNHGYTGRIADQDKVLDLVKSFEAVDGASLEKYYRHCRSIHIDVSHLAEAALDYMDLFGDSRREKIYVAQVGEEEGAASFSYTMAAASDCLRAHPALMPDSWNVAHAARDAGQIWAGCGDEVRLFEEMLATDGAALDIFKDHSGRCELNDFVCGVGARCDDMTSEVL